MELDEFEEAQKHMQGSFETHKALYGVKDKRTTGAYLEVAMAARLAGNLQHAKEILEAAEDSLLGKAQPSLVPKLSVGWGKREPGIHCLRMRLISQKSWEMVNSCVISIQL